MVFLQSASLHTGLSLKFIKCSSRSLFIANSTLDFGTRAYVSSRLDCAAVACSAATPCSATTSGCSAAFACCAATALPRCGDFFSSHEPSVHVHFFDLTQVDLGFRPSQNKFHFASLPSHEGGVHSQSDPRAAHDPCVVAPAHGASVQSHFFDLTQVDLGRRASQNAFHFGSFDLHRLIVVSFAGGDVLAALRHRFLSLVELALHVQRGPLHLSRGTLLHDFIFLSLYFYWDMLFVILSPIEYGPREVWVHERALARGGDHDLALEEHSAAGGDEHSLDRTRKLAAIKQRTTRSTS